VTLHLFCSYDVVEKNECLAGFIINMLKWFLISVQCYDNMILTECAIKEHGPSNIQF